MSNQMLINYQCASQDVTYTSPTHSHVEETEASDEALKLFEEASLSPIIISIEQVDPKRKVASFNFRTYLNIKIQRDGKLILFKPIHIGFITGKKNPSISLIKNPNLPQETSLKWDRFGSRCYNKACTGRYLVVLEIEGGQYLGLIVYVARTNQRGTHNTNDLPFYRYAWFEIRNVQSFIDETNPRLIEMWDETNQAKYQNVSFCNIEREPQVEIEPKRKRKNTDDCISVKKIKFVQ